MQSSEPEPEPFSLLIQAIQNDLAQTPDGLGGTVGYKPATKGRRGIGMDGDYFLMEWQIVTTALASESDDLIARLESAAHAVLNEGGSCDCGNPYLIGDFTDAFAAVLNRRSTSEQGDKK